MRDTPGGLPLWITTLSCGLALGLALSAQPATAAAIPKTTERSCLANPVLPVAPLDAQLPAAITIRIRIGPVGELLNAVVKESSGNVSVDAAALRAVRQSTWCSTGAPAETDVTFTFPARPADGSDDLPEASISGGFVTVALPPSTPRPPKPLSAAQRWAIETRGLSSDQKGVFKRMGMPTHVSTLDSAMGHQEIWWYGPPESWTSGESFVFLNGRLTQVSNP